MYVVGRNEKIMQTLSIDNKDVFIITINKDRTVYTLYSIDNKGIVHKESKGNNPLKLEERSGFLKMCEDWRYNNE